jgi:uncharacterized protein (DUF488 family)
MSGGRGVSVLPVRYTRAMRVWSIGHSTHTLEAFLALLAEYDITQIADIRAVPQSRRYPHFHTEALARELPRSGVAYVHLPGLGGWRRATPQSPNVAWRNLSFRGYADYAMGAEFAAALARLRALAAQMPTAMMCSEALWWRCHRRLVADRLLLGGDEVCHIGSSGGTTAHRLPPFAAIVDGRLIYKEP